MVYVPDCDADILVSYVHNEQLVTNTWVEMFLKELRTEMKGGGRDLLTISIARGDPHHRVDAKMRRRLRRSATLICILSVEGEGHEWELRLADEFLSCVESRSNVPGPLFFVTPGHGAASLYEWRTNSGHREDPIDFRYTIDVEYLDHMRDREYTKTYWGTLDAGDDSNAEKFREQMSWLCTLVSVALNESKFGNTTVHPSRGAAHGPNLALVHAIRPLREMRFDIAVSFPGEIRAYVAEIVDALRSMRDPATIFYDYDHQAQLARPNLDTLLQGIYRNQSELLVVFLCAKYAEKQWCGLEWRAIRDIIKFKEDERVMFVRLDDAVVHGVLSIDGYVDARVFGAWDVARFISERLLSLRGKSAGF